jgi:hypothetical protein
MVGTPKNMVTPAAAAPRVAITSSASKQARAGHQRAVEAGAQAVHVEERQGEQERIVGGPAPGGDDRARDGERVAVAQHRALRPAGGAAGVDEEREVVVGGRRQVPADRPGVGPRDDAVQRQDPEPRRHERRAGRRHAHDAGARVGEHVLEIAAAVEDVDRHRDRARAQGAEVGEHEAVAVLGVDRDPVTGRDAELAEPGRHPQRRHPQVVVRAIVEGERARPGRGVGVEDGQQRHGRRPCHRRPAPPSAEPSRGRACRPTSTP